MPGVRGSSFALLLSLLFVCAAHARLGGAILPADRDASANWRMAGMLSVGGIPNRTTVCENVSPLGAGKDDTANIQEAIEACPPGQVVLLSAGAFTVGGGRYVLLNRGVTLRGAGPCAGAATCTLMQRTDGCKPLSPRSSGACGASPTPMIVVGPERWNNDTVSTDLTADAAAGSHSIQVASAAGILGRSGRPPGRVVRGSVDA